MEIETAEIQDTKGTISFARNAFGRGTYNSVGQGILSAGLCVPTGAESARLVYALCKKDTSKNESFLQKVREHLRNRWLWVYQQNLWTDKGVYSRADFEAKGREEMLEVAQLEMMLRGGREVTSGGIRFSADGRVGFAPRGSYRFGEHTPASLSNDGAVIVQYGFRGAIMLSQFAEFLGKTPYTYGEEIKERQSPKQRVSTLGEDGGGLRIGGGGFGDFDGGWAFPVSARAEGAPQKNELDVAKKRVDLTARDPRAIEIDPLGTVSAQTPEAYWRKARVVDALQEREDLSEAEVRAVEEILKRRTEEKE